MGTTSSVPSTQPTTIPIPITPSTAVVLIPLPDNDFDITETALSWFVLTQAGIRVVFASERGSAGPTPKGDPYMITGVVFGQLGAEPHALECYNSMIASTEFQSTRAWNDINPSEYDGLLLPGGHAQGMKQYLGSSVLQSLVSTYWSLDRPVGAVCHGTILLARSKRVDGRSVLYEKKTMCLTKHMERSAYLLTAWKMGKYYRTYPEYVEDEVKSVLKDPDQQYVHGKCVMTVPSKGTLEKENGAEICIDGKYVSARWPGDVYLFAKEFAKLVRQEEALRLARQ